MKKKLFSILLIIAVICSILPGAASAAPQKITVENPFYDVPQGTYYHDAVLWALDSNVTTGTSKTSFSPSATCTRGQVVTFLWRALGCPEPTSSVNPFNDVKPGDYYYDAVLWAVEENVTTGTSATTFSPVGTCTSAQVITFLWRANDKPSASGTSSLAQAHQNMYYTDAVAWADTTKLMDGTGSVFSPNAHSPRADIVTYLYRNAGSPPVIEKQPSTSLNQFSPDMVPAYSGSAYVAINDNKPYFSSADYTVTAFETYSKLDSLGRCGTAYANICKEIMPTEERGEIGSVKPTGWQTAKYDFIDGKYLYNRCHLIGFQLAGENANTKNLITGTRYLNIQGMLPFENMVHDYVCETNNHVLYRVTPVFSGNNLVATGVLMEGWSVEDGGDGICFCVFAYNVQPGVKIDYATGNNTSDGTNDNSNSQVPPDQSGKTTYILNTNSHKFHVPSCSSASRISEANKQTYVGTRDNLIKQGYDPCKVCRP